MRTGASLLRDSSLKAPRWRSGVFGRKPKLPSFNPPALFPARWLGLELRLPAGGSNVSLRLRFASSGRCTPYQSGAHQKAQPESVALRLVTGSESRIRFGLCSNKALSTRRPTCSSASPSFTSTASTRPGISSWLHGTRSAQTQSGRSAADTQGGPLMFGGRFGTLQTSRNAVETSNGWWSDSSR